MARSFCCLPRPTPDSSTDAWRSADPIVNVAFAAIADPDVRAVFRCLSYAFKGRLVAADQQTAVRTPGVGEVIETLKCRACLSAEDARRWGHDQRPQGLGQPLRRPLSLPDNPYSRVQAQHPEVCLLEGNRALIFEVGQPDTATASALYAQALSSCSREPDRRLIQPPSIRFPTSPSLKRHRP
jgi:hypothetical protein